MADRKKKRLEVFVAKLRRFHCVSVTFKRIFMFDHGALLVRSAHAEIRQAEIALTCFNFRLPMFAV
jgi:hypothetical protein